MRLSVISLDHVLSLIIIEARNLDFSLRNGLILTKAKVYKMNVLFVMIGGFFGAISRFALGEWIHTSNGFPLGTLFINLIGCFFLGWFLTFVRIKKKIRPELTLLIGT